MSSTELLSSPGVQGNTEMKGERILPTGAMANNTYYSLQK